MATIAEILAARVAAAKQAEEGTASPPTAQIEERKETLAERLATKAAIDAIDPPGKPAAAAAARKMAGLILSKDMPCAPQGEPRGQATPIQGPEDPEPRSLSERALQAVPVVPVDADAPTLAWHEVMNSLDTQLCVMRDPVDAEACWLAVRPERGGLRPILIHRLPWLLWEHPLTVQSEPY